MSDLEHRSLSGASLHELKGVDSAANYEVPVAQSHETEWSLLDHNSLTGTGNPFGAQLLYVKDNSVLAAGGGALTAAVWTQRTLDTVVTNEITGASLSASQITLPAGTYYAKIKAPAYNVDKHKIRLRDVTSNTVLLESGTGYASDATQHNWIEHEGRFTLAASKKLRLEHICETTNAVNGGGIASSLGTAETYGQVYIWKVR